MADGERRCDVILSSVSHGQIGLPSHLYHHFPVTLGIIGLCIHCMYYGSSYSLSVLFWSSW